MIVKAEHLHGFVITAGFYETRVAYLLVAGSTGVHICINIPDY
jgi:hypothetical protein